MVAEVERMDWLCQLLKGTDIWTIGKGCTGRFTKPPCGAAFLPPAGRFTVWY